MKVVKFGGTSLATGAAVKQALNIITADPARQIVVVSAPGKRHDGDIKVTDLLIRYANETINGEDTAKTVQEIFERYETIGHFFDLPDEKIKIIKELLVNLPKKDYPNDEYLLAAFKAHGERLNARLIAMIMNHLGIKARFVDPTEAGIMVTGAPNDAIVNPETYRNLAGFKYEVYDRLVFLASRLLVISQRSHGAALTLPARSWPGAFTRDCMKTLPTWMQSSPLIQT